MDDIKRDAVTADEHPRHISWIFFPNPPKDKRFCFLDDPAMEIKALDPSFRIRRRVHLGSPDKTGYAYQVFIDNEKQKEKLLLYLLMRKVRSILMVHGTYAHAFDLKRMRGINSTYSQVHYYTDRRQIDRHIGYSIHLEDSLMIENIPISFSFLDEILCRHSELKRIIDKCAELRMSFEEYRKRIIDCLERNMRYSEEEVINSLEVYKDLLPVFYLENYSVIAAATMIYNEL